jgi:hypothetical protein
MDSQNRAPTMRRTIRVGEGNRGARGLVLWLVVGVCLVWGAGPGAGGNGREATQVERFVAKVEATPTLSPKVSTRLARETRRLAVRRVEGSFSERALARSQLGELIRSLAGSRLQDHRVLTLLGELNAQRRALRSLGHTPPGRSVVDGSGLVYRYFQNEGFRLHPLASFGRLNALVANGHLGRARVLSKALLLRAERTHSGEFLWHYNVGMGKASRWWTSGMAQAVAAQAFGRAGKRLRSTALIAAARAAYRGLTVGLVMQLGHGPWVKLYSFDARPILNAQLQAALSVDEYARIVRDPAAARLAESLRDSARSLLPRFDLGYWSTYALDGPAARDEYQRYVNALLRRVAAKTAENYWIRTANRFYGYIHDSPRLTLGIPRLNRGLLEQPIRTSKPITARLLAGESETMTRLTRPGWGIVAVSILDQPVRPLLIVTDAQGHEQTIALPVMDGTSRELSPRPGLHPTVIWPSGTALTIDAQASAARPQISYPSIQRALFSGAQRMRFQLQVVASRDEQNELIERVQLLVRATRRSGLIPVVRLEPSRLVRAEATVRAARRFALESPGTTIEIGGSEHVPADIYLAVSEQIRMAVPISIPLVATVPLPSQFEFLRKIAHFRKQLEHISAIVVSIGSRRSVSDVRLADTNGTLGIIGLHHLVRKVRRLRPRLLSLDLTSIDSFASEALRLVACRSEIRSVSALRNAGTSEVAAVVSAASRGILGSCKASWPALGLAVSSNHTSGQRTIKFGCSIDCVYSILARASTGRPTRGHLGRLSAGQTVAFRILKPTHGCRAEIEVVARVRPSALRRRIVSCS